MRATNFKHFNASGKDAQVSKKVSKTRKGIKALSLAIAITASAAALIVPTTTLAPGVDAYADSRIASYSVGDIDKFSAVITSNCVETTTTPAAETAKVVKQVKKAEKAAADKKASEKKAAETKAKAKAKTETNNTEESKPAAKKTQATQAATEPAFSNNTASSGDALVYGAATDPGYTPTHVSLSAYDRAKTERLVMGEGGTMGFEGCALIAQSIRDAMVRSGTTSIDQIISEYQYFGSTDFEPNQDVKDAVSYIFDQDGVAIQHRVLCFYIGTSEWHETQTYLYQIGGVRFFDLVSA